MLQIIGRLETPFRTLRDCPRNGRAPQPPPPCRAHIDPPWVAGLAGLEGFSHLILLYWLGQVTEAHLCSTVGGVPTRNPPYLDQVTEAQICFTPPFDTERRGVFSTRAPARPNPIGLSVVAFEGFEDPGCLRVRYLDCVDGTGLLDIKPYLPSTDSEPMATTGWLTPYLGQT